MGTMSGYYLEGGWVLVLRLCIALVYSSRDGGLLNNYQERLFINSEIPI